MVDKVAASHVVELFRETARVALAAFLELDLSIIKIWDFTLLRQAK